MKTTLDALVRRVTIFVGATLGTFVTYIIVGVTYGAVTETLTPDVLSLGVAIVLVRVVVNMTAGHAVALAGLAFVARGFSTPSLTRSAVSGIACASVLEAAYLWSPASAAVVQYRIAQLGVGIIVSAMICAVRAPGREAEKEPIVVELA